MTTTDIHPPSGRYGYAEQPGFFARSEMWLDERGKGAWIAAMVLGFIFFWPVGLALLAYMIWGKQMFKGSSRSCSRRARRANMKAMAAAGRTSGNAAFDNYKAETLRRLEDEQHQFESFLERLREAKDKAEFDQFMDDRASRNDPEGPNGSPDPEGQDRKDAA